MTVLDASAVLALLLDKPGADAVEDAIDDDAVEDAIDDGAVISAVDLSEVLLKMAHAGADPERAVGLIGGLFVEVVPYGLDAAEDGAAVGSTARGSGLSLGDRACLSLARARTRRVLTADRAWLDHASALDVQVTTIR